MAKFYGTVTGAAKTTATRRGHRTIRTVAASWHGAVETALWEQNGKTWARVSLIPWHGEGTHRLLWEGTVNGKEEG